MKTFQSHTLCIYRFPDGTKWHIKRWFRRTDVRRFRKHYRIWWVGHLLPALRSDALNDIVNPRITGRNPQVFDPRLRRRFGLALDHLEVVLPMRPADPDPATKINENVMIEVLGEPPNPDGTPRVHFLGEESFGQMPDIATEEQNHQLLTTAKASHHLTAQGHDLLQDAPIIPDPAQGMVQIAPGAVAQWIVGEGGTVMPHDQLSLAQVLGQQTNAGLVGDPQDPDQIPNGEDEHELMVQLDWPDVSCWELDPEGNIVGAAPGQIVIGPPALVANPNDPEGPGIMDPASAPGGPIPVDPTVRDENDNVLEESPFAMAVVEEPEPNPEQLAQFNEQLFQLGLAPLRPPFALCIKSIRVHRWWGIDRRTVMDSWFHHWEWFVRHHLTLTGLHRIWVTGKALTHFKSQHQHFTHDALGKPRPATWWGFGLTHVKYFRACYRVLCPGPGIFRVRIDGLWIVVSMNPDNPDEGLMLLTTEANENTLPPAAVLAGLVTPSLQGDDDQDGVTVEELDPLFMAAIWVSVRRARLTAI